MSQHDQKFEKSTPRNVCDGNVNSSFIQKKLVQVSQKRKESPRGKDELNVCLPDLL